MIDGADVEKQDSIFVVLLLPLLFFLRRLVMCLTLIFWIDFFWGQVALQIFVSVILVIYIGWSRPLDSNFANNIEIFNEMTTLWILQLMMCFSDFVGEAEMRNEIGKAFIGLILFYVAVHFFFLTVDCLKSIISSLINRFKKCKQKKSAESLKALKKAPYLE